MILEGHRYHARVLRHNVFDLRSASEEGIDALSRVSVTLANADSYFSQVERASGWKGARLNVRFLFLNASTGEAASDEMVVFKGACNPPDEITESTIRLSFVSRMNLQRILLPEARIQRRCPWMFPSTEAQRQLALTGGAAASTRHFSDAGTRQI